MSYRCQVCQEPVPAGTQRKVHVVRREVPAGLRPDGHGRLVPAVRREVAREVPVCGACHRLLERGVPLDRVRRQRRARPAAAPAVCLARNSAIQFPDDSEDAELA